LALRVPGERIGSESMGKRFGLSDYHILGPDYHKKNPDRRLMK